MYRAWGVMTPLLLKGASRRPGFGIVLVFALLCCAGKG